MAASWSTLLPDTSSAREPIREAVDRVTELRGQVPAGCEAVSEAKAALERVQRDSQAEMATAIRQGDPAEPDTAAIEAARVQVDRAEGQLAALGQAIELEEAELGRVIAESRTKWLESVKRTEAAHRKSGLAALCKLQEAVEGLRSTAIAELWLKPGGLAVSGARPRPA